MNDSNPIINSIINYLENKENRYLIKYFPDNKPYGIVHSYYIEATDFNNCYYKLICHSPLKLNLTGVFKSLSETQRTILTRFIKDNGFLSENRITDILTKLFSIIKYEKKTDFYLINSYFIIDNSYLEHIIDFILKNNWITNDFLASEVFESYYNTIEIVLDDYKPLNLSKSNTNDKIDYSATTYQS